MKKIFFLPLFLLSFCLTQQSLYAESITLTTYYPAPFGAYDRLRLVPRAPLDGEGACNPGTFYVDNITNQMQFCQSDRTWGSVTGVWVKRDDNIYPADTNANPNLRVGIGTTNPGAIDLGFTDRRRLRNVPIKLDIFDNLARIRGDGARPDLPTALVIDEDTRTGGGSCTDPDGPGCGTEASASLAFYRRGVYKWAMILGDYDGLNIYNAMIPAPAFVAAPDTNAITMARDQQGHWPNTAYDGIQSRVKVHGATGKDSGIMMHSDADRAAALGFVHGAADYGDSEWEIVSVGTASSPNHRLGINAVLGTTGGGERLTILQDGNVGIGTTSPKGDAPNGQPGNLDVNDVYLRAANGGTGGWVSQSNKMTYLNRVLVGIGVGAGSLGYPSEIPTTATNIIVTFHVMTRSKQNCELYASADNFGERSFAHSYSPNNSDDAASDMNTVILPYSNSRSLNFRLQPLGPLPTCTGADVAFDGYM